ncbi:MAG: hypothetical protein EPN48_13425 [Microbacteriaceae bacterium]|nr:MAG: hypothetical protein EPN48_13425 [Microbacteriaceae bacterium]
MVRRAACGTALVLLAAVLTPIGPVSASAAPVSAASARATQPFDPGYIISDENFYDPNSMTRQQIQSFLRARTCIPKDDVPCLADYRQTTASQPAEFAHCAAYVGARSERASAIIAKVATACGISPRVLLVLLQKEQSLVTRPSTYGYQRATGYACPDTSACDRQYFGFFNQVYNAAWQFREYSAAPGWRYHIGRVRVQFSPDAKCGSTIVTIRNQATADLYNYTPYQPNAGTVAAPSAPPTACSAYGNLNFSRIYAQWFGDPTAWSLPDWWGTCLLYLGGRDCPTDPTAVSVP